MITTDSFRRALGHLPTGVIIVTSIMDDEPIAMVIRSFTSVSLDPPLVGCFSETASKGSVALIDWVARLRGLVVESGQIAWASSSNAAATRSRS